MLGEALDEARGVVALEVLHGDGQTLVHLEQLHHEDGVVLVLRLLQPLVQLLPPLGCDEPAEQSSEIIVVVIVIIVVFG